MWLHPTLWLRQLWLSSACFHQLFPDALTIRSSRYCLNIMLLQNNIQLLCFSYSADTNFGSPPFGVTLFFFSWKSAKKIIALETSVFIQIWWNWLIRPAVTRMDGWMDNRHVVYLCNPSASLWAPDQKKKNCSAHIFCISWWNLICKLVCMRSALLNLSVWHRLGECI